MSDLIDDGNENSNEELGTYEDLLNSSSEPVANEAAEAPKEPVEDDVPEKYRGKSAKEIAKMHMEAEKALGRQGSEVGELRKLVDDYIRSQTIKEQQQQLRNTPEQDDNEEIDFFVDPQKAIDKAIAKHPKIKQAEELTANIKRQEALAVLKANHPDFQDVVSDPSFTEWIGKSKVRQELYLRADKGFDYEAADELLTTFKERKQVIEQAKTVEQATRKQTVKAASTGSSTGTGSERLSQKTYRRADIIQLMMSNPDRYQALQPEIMKAYAEGRVR